MGFLDNIKTHHQENERKYCQFLRLCNLFSEYVGTTDKITQEEYNHIHPLFLESIQRIIKSTVKKQYIRELYINNMLS